MESLFTNEKDYNAFCNVLAYRRKKELNNEINELQAEIAEILKKSDEIFKKYGAKSNYIADIIETEMKIQSIGGENNE